MREREREKCNRCRTFRVDTSQFPHAAILAQRHEQQQLCRENHPVQLAQGAAVKVHLVQELAALGGAEQVLSGGVLKTVRLHDACFVKVTWRTDLICGKSRISLQGYARNE